MFGGCASVRGFGLFYEGTDAFVVAVHYDDLIQTDVIGGRDEQDTYQNQDDPLPIRPIRHPHPYPCLCTTVVVIRLMISDDDDDG